VKVLVDTPIWSYALRTPTEEYQNEIDQLTSLIRDQRALIIGPIRQELLSAIVIYASLKIPLFKILTMNWQLSYATNAGRKEFMAPTLIFLYALFQKELTFPFLPLIKISLITKELFQ
jgi:hypothetical protein